MATPSRSASARYVMPASCAEVTASASAVRACTNSACRSRTSSAGERAGSAGASGAGRAGLLVGIRTTLARAGSFPFLRHGVHPRHRSSHGVLRAPAARPSRHGAGCCIGHQLACPAGGTNVSARMAPRCHRAASVDASHVLERVLTAAALGDLPQSRRWRNHRNDPAIDRTCSVQARTTRLPDAAPTRRAKDAGTLEPTTDPAGSASAIDSSIRSSSARAAPTFDSRMVHRCTKGSQAGPSRSAGARATRALLVCPDLRRYP